MTDTAVTGTARSGAGVSGAAANSIDGNRVALTGWSVHLPGAQAHAALPDMGDACLPEDAANLLGRKGLLMKEPATRLALCAVHRALGMGVGERADGQVRTDTAVVASSNLGNVETVVQVVRTVAAEGGKAVSPMAAPNASSNVLSGTVAMWFKFGGPNLMVCSGRDSGFQAVRLAILLLRSGRARRVVVVGAEPADPVATALHRQGGFRAPLRAGAACVILECGDNGLSLEQVNDGTPVRASELDIVPVWGDCYGAQGVLELALAAQLATKGGQPVRAGRLTLHPARAA